MVETLIDDTAGDAPAFELGWDTAGKYLVVIIRGSSSCHGDVQQVTKTGEQAITIAVSPGPPPGTACLADLAAFENDVIVPLGIVRSQPLQVHIYEQTVVVPAEGAALSPLASTPGVRLTVPTSGWQPGQPSLGASLAPAALAVGSDGCLHYGRKGPLIIWPDGYYAQASVDRTVEVYGDDGVQRTKTGDEFSVAGAADDPQHVARSIGSCDLGHGTWFVETDSFH